MISVLHVAPRTRIEQVCFQTGCSSILYITILYSTAKNLAILYLNIARAKESNLGVTVHGFVFTVLYFSGLFYT